MSIWASAVRFTGGSVHGVGAFDLGGSTRTCDVGRRRAMGANAEAIARRFEAKVQDARATLENLGDADWKRITPAEQWPHFGSIRRAVGPAPAG
jgi:hypothetical protein